MNRRRAPRLLSIAVGTTVVLSMVLAPTAPAASTSEADSTSRSRPPVDETFRDTFESPPDPSAPPPREVQRSIQPGLASTAPAPAAVRSINKAPTVGVNPTLVVAEGSTIDLSGFVDDDAVAWPPGYLDWRWWQHSGPDAAVIADDFALRTRVRVGGAGQYWFGLTATDGAAYTTRFVAVNVVASADVGRFRRVMLIGDSITEGLGRDRFGYRPDLWQALGASSCLVDLVGERFQNHEGQMSGAVAFDPHHESFSGLRVAEVARNVSDDLDHHRPDVAVVMLGTNDVAQGFPAAKVAGDLRALIDELLDRQPGIEIVLAQLIPASFDTKGRIEALNSEIVALAAEREHVVSVDLHSGFDPAWLVDGTHPDATGEAWLAEQLAPAVIAAAGPACSG